MKLPNRKNLTFKIKPHNYAKWVAERVNSIGGSDIGTIMNLNKYSSAIELFHIKCGLIESSTEEKISTYSGKVTEDLIIRDYWQYYNPTKPTDEEFLANATQKNIIRKARKFHRTMFLNNTPLSASVDALFEGAGTSPDGVLEIKNQLSFVTRQYIGGVAPSYIIQLQTYLMLTGFEYGEICSLEDGRFMKVYPIEANKDIHARILEQVMGFWSNVLKAREIVNHPTMPRHEKIIAISPLEPEPDGGEALKEYLDKRYTEEGKLGKIIGTPEIMETVDKYLDSREREKIASGEKQLHGNILRDFLLKNTCDEITDQEGKVIASYRTWSGKAMLKVN
jgi:predicted phage-related endonuclease